MAYAPTPPPPTITPPLSSAIHAWFISSEEVWHMPPPHPHPHPPPLLLLLVLQFMPDSLAVRRYGRCPSPHPIHCSYWCCDSMCCGTAVVFWPVFFHSADTKQKDQTQTDTLPGRQVWRWHGRQPGMQTHTHTQTTHTIYIYTSHTIITHTHMHTRIHSQSHNQAINQCFMSVHNELI